jgi:hypothetical protein
MLLQHQGGSVTGVDGHADIPMTDTLTTATRMHNTTARSNVNICFKKDIVNTHAAHKTCNYVLVLLGTLAI